MAGLGVNDTISALGQRLASTPRADHYLRSSCATNFEPLQSENVLHGIAILLAAACLAIWNASSAGCHAVIERNSWRVPPVMTWLQQLGGIESHEMDLVFNMGIGLVLVFNPHYEANVRRTLEECGLESWKIGDIVSGEHGVSWKAEVKSSQRRKIYMIRSSMWCSINQKFRPTPATSVVPVWR